MTPEPVHVRMPLAAANGEIARFCDATSGGTISLTHYNEKRWHVDTLKMCPDCVRFVTITNAKESISPYAANRRMERMFPNWMVRPRNVRGAPV
jgi:hypothetical protein